jgi:hypothetical protein
VPPIFKERAFPNPRTLLLFGLGIVGLLGFARGRLGRMLSSSPAATEVATRSRGQFMLETCLTCHYARENLTRAVVALVELDGKLDVRLREGLRQIMYVPPSALPSGPFRTAQRALQAKVHPLGVHDYVRIIPPEKRTAAGRRDILALRDDAVDAAFNPLYSLTGARR